MAGTMIGTEINGPNNDRLLLTDYLGQGFFGEVYRAVGLTSGRIVAVKLIPSNILQNPDSKRALFNEIKLANKITHPNVVQVLYVNTDDTPIGPYMVMEYVSGGTLAGLIRTQRSANSSIPLLRCREMMIDIAQGARAINEQLVHRDIKPDNILIDEAHLKIGDFGISKVIDEQTRTMTFKGGQHVMYMAPEGWENQTNSYKLDVYSVGLVFYEILTLRHPLRQFIDDPNDWRGWREAHLFSVIPDIRKIRTDINLAIAQLTWRMVSKRPQDRPGWDEVISILSANDGPPPQPNAVAKAVEIAISHQQELEIKNLAAQQLTEKENRKNELYHYSCKQLINAFDSVVEQFNAQYQQKRIAKRSEGLNTYVYTMPNGGLITFTFFPRKETDIQIKGGQLIGGGYVEIENSVSANLLLVQDGEDDLYGRWIGCLLKLGLGDPSKVVGSRGITRQTKVPFGLKYESDFYQDMRYAEHGIYIFNYELRTDIDTFLVDVLETGL